MVRLEIEKGEYLFKLQDILKKKNISINKLMRDTNTDFKVLKRMMTGEFVRFDIFVVAASHFKLPVSIFVIRFTTITNNPQISVAQHCAGIFPIHIIPRISQVVLFSSPDSSLVNQSPSVL